MTFNPFSLVRIRCAHVIVFFACSTLLAASPPPDAPKHILNLQSRMDLSETVEFDVIGRYVGRRALTSFSGAPVEVPSWWTMDVRIGWRPLPNLELALIGKNLLSPSHPEFKEVYVPILSTEIQRSFVGTVKWSF